MAAEANRYTWQGYSFVQTFPSYIVVLLHIGKETGEVNYYTAAVVFSYGRANTFIKSTVPGFFFKNAK